MSSLKKNLILTLTVVFLVEFVSAQTTIWAYGYGGNDDDYSSGVVRDNSGNIIMSGSYSSHNLTFGTSTLVNPMFTGGIYYPNMFVAKFNSSGTALWAQSAYLNTANCNANAVAVDTSGNVYVVGSFWGAVVNLGGGGALNNGVGNIFIVKYSPAGAVLWEREFGGDFVDDAYAVTVNNTGQILITGYTSSSSITFGATTLFNSTGNFKLLLVKLSALGGVVWAKSFDAGISAIGNSVSTDNASDIVVTGEFNGTDFILGSDTLHDNGGSDLFLAKFNNSGVPLWGRSAGGANEDIAFATVADNLGNYYIAGSFESNSITVGSDTLTNTGMKDLFVLKYDDSGNYLWSKSEGGATNERALSITADAGGNVVAAGDHASNVYLVKYDGAGNKIWDKTISGPGGFDGAASVKMNGLTTDILLAGSYKCPSIVFDATALANIHGTSSEIFLAKIATPLGVAEFSNADNNRLMVYPNPLSGVYPLHLGLSLNDAELIIYDAHGSEAMRKKISGSVIEAGIQDLKQGIYFLSISNGEQHYTAKFIVE